MWNVMLLRVVFAGYSEMGIVTSPKLMAPFHIARAMAYLRSSDALASIPAWQEPAATAAGARRVSSVDGKPRGRRRAGVHREETAIATDGAVKEEMTQKAMPLDVMIATFGARQDAKQAYDALKTMDRDGTIDMGSAFVFDRTEKGDLRPIGMKMPGWVWASIVGASVLMFGLIAAVVWLGMLAARGYQSSYGEGGGMREGEQTRGMAEGADYSTSGRESRRYEREGMRMGME
jgi:hypothetical protein